MGIRNAYSEEQDAEDPFKILGFGVNAYLKMALGLIGLLLLLSILFAFPFAYVFGNYYGALADQTNYNLSKYTLGNMGGA